MHEKPRSISGPLLPSIYSLQDCTACDAAGVTKQGSCPVCLGEGNVLVVECPRCCGSGVERSNSDEESSECSICSGSGWAMMVRKAAHH